MVDFSFKGITKSTIGILAIGAILFVFVGATGSSLGGSVGEMSKSLFQFGQIAFVTVVVALIIIVIIMNAHKFK